MQISNLVYRTTAHDGSQSVNYVAYIAGNNPLNGLIQQGNKVEIIYDEPAYTSQTSSLCTNHPDDGSETYVEVLLYISPVHCVQAYGMYYDNSKFTSDADFCPFDIIDYINDDTAYAIAHSDGYDYNGLGVQAVNRLKELFADPRVISLDAAYQLTVINPHLYQVYLNSIPPEYQGSYLKLLIISAYYGLS